MKKTPTTMAEAVAILKHDLAEKPLPLDDFMHAHIVDDYLLQWLPDTSGRTVAYLHKNIYRDVVGFIRWWADQIGTDALTLDDAQNLNEQFVQKYAIQQTDSKTSQKGRNATLSGFANKNPNVFYSNPWKRLVSSAIQTDSEPTFVYNVENLGKFYEGLNQIAKRGTQKAHRAEVRWRYRNWLMFLLQTGLRQSHARLFTYGHIFEAVENVKEGVRYRGVPLTKVQNFMGDIFYPIPAKPIVSEGKKARNEVISPKKGVMEFVYIHEDLYQSIRDLYEYAKFKETDNLLGVYESTAWGVGVTVMKMMDLPDFTWSLRHTWATVYYIMSGKNLSALAEAGGWTSTEIPFRYYLRVMNERDAYHIMKDYHIYLDPELSLQARAVEYAVLNPGAPRLEEPDIEKELITVRRVDYEEAMRAGRAPAGEEDDMIPMTQSEYSAAIVKGVRDELAKRGIT